MEDTEDTFTRAGLWFTGAPWTGFGFTGHRSTSGIWKSTAEIRRRCFTQQSSAGTQLSSGAPETTPSLWTLDSHDVSANKSASPKGMQAAGVDRWEPAPERKKVMDRS